MAGIQGLSDLPKKVKAIIILVPVFTYLLFEDITLSIELFLALVVVSFIVYWIKALFDKEEDESSLDSIQVKKNKYYRNDHIGKSNTREIDSFEKGMVFEQYLLENAFPSTQFDVIEQTHSYSTNSKRFVESTLNPDFKLRNKLTGQEFWIEAKYRFGFYNERVDLFKSNQLERYKYISASEPIFLILGMGPSPSDIDSLSLIPFDDINYPHLFISEVKRYYISSNKELIKKIDSYFSNSL